MMSKFAWAEFSGTRGANRCRDLMRNEKKKKKMEVCCVFLRMDCSRKNLSVLAGLSTRVKVYFRR